VRGPPLSVRARAALVALVAVATLGLAVAPGRLGSPIRRLANYRADTRDPIYNADVDPVAIRRAGDLLSTSSNSTYFIYTGPHPQLGHDLIGAGLLFFTPARAVPEVGEAQWVLSYDAPRLVPPGVRVRRVHTLGSHIFLVRVGRS
jgi:hypothetical protein